MLKTNRQPITSKLYIMWKKLRIKVFRGGGLLTIVQDDGSRILRLVIITKFWKHREKTWICEVKSLNYD